ncbi:dTMP kinase [Patescibacteria group bacterium]|nr:dTMP kinase [Patescibacteria group bacterium]
MNSGSIKKMHPYPGVYISLEGGDGGGKSTQRKLLEEKIGQGNFVFIREAGSTPVGEVIKALLDNNEYEGKICAETEALLFAAQRAQLIQDVIVPALKEGKTVVAERSVYSSLVYQGKVRGLGRYVEDINFPILRGVFPDIVLCFDIDPGVGLARKSSKGKDRIEREGSDFHSQIREGYLKLAADNDNFVIIDATQPIEVQSEIIWEVVKPFLVRDENVEPRQDLGAELNFQVSIHRERG